ncbi:hypothetical protein P3551_21070 [Vibrio parahaemolyticus]|uniref:hypothetical protein n=1 Tax=Vibrio parahaemolyticus TaxID=670 RepID=UPI00112260B7|nr:hypothetical protein [Vibrio parahaemolyticus]MBE4286438.1 hypothetical protein [Vibrio parahaemolyticus]MDF4901774.1 hypothetical protein [Vibrio parahaemolyticus]TOH18930.1 hypothetical protein CGI90_04225 [Vibrio parahaemolyticus]HCG7330478.1 hypothetical protein [Vibrio parahaemolyticus]HCG8860069.1 hypothetical protein [Vibrio parahaemolyticus]
MTPNELLAEVKQRFSILLLDKDEQFQSILKQALSKYQELAGFNAKCRFNSTELDTNQSTKVPNLFGARLGCRDANGKFISCQQWLDTLEFRISEDTVFPITLMYAEDVLNADLNTYQLPPNSISVLGDYLQLLIQIPNAERERRVATSGKLDTSDIPAEADLAARKTELESQMRLNRAVVPPVSL